MPSVRSYKLLHEQVVARPGAEERLAALREATLEEIGRYELRQDAERSQMAMAAVFEVTRICETVWRGGRR